MFLALDRDGVDCGEDDMQNTNRSERYVSSAV